MQVRPIKLEEIERFKEIEADAFVLGEAPRVSEWIERDIKPHLDNTRALFDNEDEIITALRIIYPRLWLGDSNVPMAGITSVASPPENRRKGYINKLLIPVLHELKEKGYSLSTLYPFYFPFYKKFGYEQVSSSKITTLPFPSLQKFKPHLKGSWKKAGIEQWQEFDSVYNKFSQGRYGFITRDSDRWQGGWLRGYKTTPKSYLWYDELGNSQAYVIYGFKEIAEWKRELQVRDMGWTGLDAQREVLAFLANHDSQAEKISWTAAPDDEFFALLDDPRTAQEELHPGYMLRILDAAKALEERPWPRQYRGSFTIAIRDNLLDWNNGVLKVEVEEGQGRVELLPNLSEPGLKCDIRQLSQLYAGYLSPLQLSRLGLLEVNNNNHLQIAQNLFHPSGQRASYMADHF